MSRPRGNATIETIWKIATHEMPAGCQVNRVELRYSCGHHSCDVDVRIIVRIRVNSPESAAWERSIKHNIWQAFSRAGDPVRITLESYENGSTS